MRIAAPVGDDRLASPAPPRSRDAGETRRLLLEAARRRFAFDGYAATTVREIAHDVGVNVALINRYFTSKEGLFEACIASAGEDLVRPDSEGLTVEQISAGMVSQLVDSTAGEDPAQLQLLLLLRSSGDERAEEIRRNIIRSFAERMAIAAGWKKDGPDDDQLVLRAQIALATALGIVLLRSSSGLEPLTSATEADLTKPVGDVLSALLLRS